MNRLKMLLDAGVDIIHDSEYRGDPPNRERHTLEDTVRSVRFPFTAEDWCYVAMREPGFDGGLDELFSSYMGGCCGNMSALQDIINSVFRDGGYCDNATFLMVGEMARDHDGFELFEPMDDATFEKKLKAWKVQEAKMVGNPEQRIDPYAKLGIVYNGVEAYLKPKDSGATEADDTRYKDEAPGEKEFDLLERTLTALSWTDLFSRPEGDEDHASTHEANRKLLVAKMVEPTRAVLRAVEEQMEELFAGFAIVEKGTDRPMRNMRGECIYGTREAAERIHELWGRNDPASVEASEIVPITITLEDGLKVRRT